MDIGDVCTGKAFTFSILSISALILKCKLKPHTKDKKSKTNCLFCKDLDHRELFYVTFANLNIHIKLLKKCFATRSVETIDGVRPIHHSSDCI